MTYNANSLQLATLTRSDIRARLEPAEEQSGQFMGATHLTNPRMLRPLPVPRGAALPRELHAKRTREGVKTSQAPPCAKGDGLSGALTAAITRW
jgi:hypothetical protein